MVSKVAVMAVVGILAVPILLGYALNIEQSTETDYRSSNDLVDVTQLLSNGTGYTTAQADINELNTKFTTLGSMIDAYPEYQRVTTTKTSINIMYEQTTYSPWIFDSESLKRLNFYVEGSTPSSYLSTVTLYSDDNRATWIQANTYNNVVGFNLTDVHGYKYAELLYDDNGTLRNVSFSQQEGQGNRIWAFHSYRINGFAGTINTYYLPEVGGIYYADISAGYKIPAVPINSPYLGQTHTLGVINFPATAKSALITINLSSITDSSYKFALGELMLEKTTTDGVVSWTVKDRTDVTRPEPINQPIYYDNNSNNNTYQLLLWADENSATPWPNFPGWYQFDLHYDFRYVGSWPSLIGEANYYKSYDVEVTNIANMPRIASLTVGGYADKSPLMRVDAATYRAMEIPMITDQIYDPAAFKTNPATTINDPVVYGPSFTFAGNTYTVKEGNITMGTHDIPVKGLVLSSVPNEGGGYDNKIGNTVISTTATPSTITFNGKWSASISTVSQEEYEFTKNEWKAGSFAWDGIDQNFLMVGLLASLGAFIALGIYARRSRATIWPLLIVCGGAALLFFVML